MLRFAVALALLAAAPAAAQPEPADPPAIPADALVPNEEARVFFEALASNVMTDELLAQMIQGMPGGDPGPMDDVIEQAMAAGELVPNWQRSGIDLLRMIAALDGGVAGNIFEARGEFGLYQTYFVDVPFEDVVHPEWVLVGRHGTPVSAENVQTGVMRVSPKVILVERTAYRREGNAYCRERAESRLYADSAVAASEFDTIAVIMGMRSLSTLEGRGLCQVMEEVGPGRYRTRLFDAAGHRLPALEEPAVFQIVRRPTQPRSR